MPLRYTRRVIVNFLEGAILVTLIAAAGYVSVGRILVSNVSKFRIDIEKSLSKRLNVDVHIGKIGGGWVYLDPLISIDQLIIGDPGHPAIRIGHASARIDSLASLLERNVVVRNLDIAGLAFTVTQDKNESWHIEGMPRGKGKPFNANPLLDSVRYLHGVDVSRVNIDIDARHGHYHIANQPDKPFELVQEGVEKTFYVPLAITHSGSRSANQFELLGRYRGDPRDLTSFSANLYLRLPQIEVSDFLPRKLGGLEINRIGLRGQMWLDSNHGEFEMRGLPVVNEISVMHDGKPVTVIRNFTATLAAGTWASGEWQAHMADFKAQIGDGRWKGKSMDVALRHGKKGWSWAAQLPNLDVAEIVRMLANVGKSGGYLTSQNLAVLDAIKPSGKLADILVKSEPDHSGPKLTAIVRDAHISAYRRSPGISDVNGFVALTPNHGYIDIYNHKRFTVDFSMFPEPWVLDGAQARLHYDHSPGYFHVSSGLIHLNMGSMKANARVNLNMPKNPILRSWGLEIGIRDTPIPDVHKYLPVTLSDNLTQWLHRALKGGEVVESGLLFHGSLGKGLPVASKTYELFFKPRGATLDYDPHWPPVDHLNATVYIGNWGVASDDLGGVIYGSKITEGHLSLPVIKDEPADSILIDAKIDGPVTDGIKVMTQTPVANATNNLAKTWIGSGEMDAHMKLNVPIGDRVGQPAGVDVTVNLTGDNIMMADYNLDVLNIDGSFQYRNDAGFSSKAFTASLFNQPVHGNIETNSGKQGSAVDLRLLGKIDVKDLYKWSGQTILSRASGISDYSARLHIPVGPANGRLSWVEARSNLVGVKIDLPPPMGKQQDEKKALVYRQTFRKPGYQVDLTLGDRTRASLLTRDGIVRGGKLQFGKSPLGKVNYDKVRVTGHLNFVNYGRWEKVTKYLDSKSKVSLTSAAANTLDYIDVDVDTLEAFGLSLHDVHSHITRQQGAWDVALKNTRLAGRIKVPDDTKQPLKVALDYLHYDSKGGKSSEGKSAADPLAGIDPTAFLPVDFKTRQLTLNGVDYGKWAFKFRPDKNGAMLNDLTAEVKGLSIQPDSRVSWITTDKSARTAFKGTIKVHDLAKALKAWGFASSIEGKDFVFDTDVAWPGSPVNVGLYNMQGMVKLNQGQGRFVQAEAGGALKLLGIFDFASLARRFRLDFSDIVKKGFSFSEIKGSARMSNGVVSVVNPIEITGPSSTIKLGGTINLKSGRLDNDMVVTLPVARNLPWYAAYSAIAAGPLTGAGVWLAQKIFGSQINQMSSAKYKISGTIDQPAIEFVSIFNDKVREYAAEPEPLDAPPKAATNEPKSTVGSPEK